MTVPVLGEALLVAAGAAIIAVAAIRLARRARDRRYGRLVSVDAGPDGGARLRSERFRISGRPDVVRRRRDGRSIPVELKTHPLPAGGPPRSHIVQVWAYCLLLEETEGVPPPFGVLRYGDGREVTVPWGREERGILLGIRRAMDLPYDGRARPSRARCAQCRWRAICDART